MATWLNKVNTLKGTIMTKTARSVALAQSNGFNTQIYSLSKPSVNLNEMSKRETFFYFCTSSSFAYARSQWIININLLASLVSILSTLNVEFIAKVSFWNICNIDGFMYKCGEL